MADKIATRASYGRALVELGAENPDIVVLDADLSGSTQTKKFAEKYPDSVNKFLAEYAASTAYVNENVKEAAELTEHFGIIDAAIAEKAIPDCNIVCLTDDDMKAAVSGYLTVLYEQKPESVGGKLPGSDFYYYTGE